MVGGAVGLLLFGAAGLVYFMLPRSGRGHDEAVLETVQARGSRQPALVFPTWRREAWMTVLLAASWATASVLMLANADTFADTWPRSVVVGVAWCGTVLFGGFFLGAAALLRFSFRLALMPEGMLLIRAFGPIFVPWDELVSVGLAESSDRYEATVVVRLRPGASVPWRHRFGILLTRVFFSWHLSMPAVQFAAPSTTVERTIRYYLENPAERETLGRKPLPREVLGS